MTHSRPARTLFEWCSHSVNVLWGANCFNPPTFLVNRWAGPFKVVYPRLYVLSWRHFTVSMNPEFLAKFTSGGNVAIVVLIKWFYGESTLCTIPRLHFKLNAIHGHATLQHPSPSPLTLKIENTVANRTIHWRTLYLCRIFQHSNVKESAKIFQGSGLCTFWHLIGRIFHMHENLTERPNWIQGYRNLFGGFVESELK